MIRLFDQHRIRRQKELDGMWKFMKLDNPGSNGKLYDLPVPGCWEQHPEMLTYRGKGVFYKTVYVQQETNIRLEFKGVSHTAEVYFDDVFVSSHYNAYTGFSGIIRKVSPGEHRIEVCVDNSFTEESSLHVPNDYYTYGGLIRTVVMEEIPEIYIRGVRFTPSSANKVWNGKIEVDLENLSDVITEIEVEIELVGEVIRHVCGVEGSGRTLITLEHQYTNVLPWNVGEPNLYLLDTKLKTVDGKVIDDYIERVGFREIRIEGRRLLVNGKPVFLKGFNRHEDYGTLGSSIPLQVMVQDMDLMQEVGSNAVRTCHYPNDERFLDLCDERGILVWEENHARGFNLERMQNPHFEAQCEDCINEMIEQHYNHPSIVIWGILNECASETTEGRAMYQKQYKQIECLDPSRPTTSATCRHFTDICLDLPDIVSFNIYSGWYEDVPVKDQHEKEMDWLDSAAGKEKPIIVSEFGAAAMYGYRDRGHCKWSEERQADVIRENLEVYREDDRLTGVFIWQFADCKVTEEEWFFPRPRCHNNKGLVDEYRRPKEAFDVVKEMFKTMGV